MAAEKRYDRCMIFKIMANIFVYLFTFYFLISLIKRGLEKHIFI
jgi:hypothetical protein